MADDFEFVDDDDFEFVDDADFDWEGFAVKGSKSEHLSKKVSLSGLMRMKIPGSKT